MLQDTRIVEQACQFPNPGLEIGMVQPRAIADQYGSGILEIPWATGEYLHDYKIFGSAEADRLVAHLACDSSGNGVSLEGKQGKDDVQRSTLGAGQWQDPGPSHELKRFGHSAGECYCQAECYGSGPLGLCPYGYVNV